MTVRILLILLSLMTAAGTAATASDRHLLKDYGCSIELPSFQWRYGGLKKSRGEGYRFHAENTQFNLYLRLLVTPMNDELNFGSEEAMQSFEEGYFEDGTNIRRRISTTVSNQPAWEWIVENHSSGYDSSSVSSVDHVLVVQRKPWSYTVIGSVPFGWIDEITPVVRSLRFHDSQFVAVYAEQQRQVIKLGEFVGDGPAPMHMDNTLDSMNKLGGWVFSLALLGVFLLLIRVMVRSSREHREDREHERRMRRYHAEQAEQAEGEKDAAP